MSAKRLIIDVNFENAPECSLTCGHPPREERSSQAGTATALRERVRDAVRCHFDLGTAPEQDCIS